MASTLGSGRILASRRTSGGIDMRIFEAHQAEEAAEWEGTTSDEDE